MLCLSYLRTVRPRTAAHIENVGWIMWKYIKKKDKGGIFLKRAPFYLRRYSVSVMFVMQCDAATNSDGVIGRNTAESH